MLYGHKEIVDNRIATLVSSATTVEEFDKFLHVVAAQNPKTRNFNEMYTSQVLQHLMEETYKGFKKPIHVFYHDDETQREAFIKEWSIEIVVAKANALDRQADMLWEKEKRQIQAEKKARDAAEEAAEAAGQEYTGDREKTIEEMYGLDKHDPWDSRTQEEREHDQEMREYARKARAAGTMTTDSFEAPVTPRQAPPDQMQMPPDMMPGNAPDAFDGTPPDQMAPDQMGNPQGQQGQLNVNKIEADIDSNGNINFASVRATKTGGPVDENLKAAREKAYDDLKNEKLGGRDQFSPEDFAAILAGDGSSSANMVKGNGDKLDENNLSDQAQKVRQDARDGEAAAMEQTRRENDFKDQQERDRGIFRGSDLYGEDEQRVDELDSAIQAELANLGYTDAKIGVKDYPINSQLGQRSVLPFDEFAAIQQAGGESVVTNIAATVNVKIEGMMSMGGANALVVSIDDQSNSGWVVYQTTGGPLGETIETTLVRIR